MKLFLLGLRRSGTTAFFHTMRQDRRFVCYDEPFNGMLRDMPGGNEWGTQDEFLRLFEKSPETYWARYAPLDGLDEIRDGMEPRNREWLEYLLGSAENVFMDFTRCNFKVPALKELAPDAVVIHLYRSPACIASSHMLPSIWKEGRKLKYWRVKRKFWKKAKKYNFWGFETIIGRHPQSFCGHRFKEIGLDPDMVYGLPAVGRMMAFWRLNHERVEADGRAQFGERFVSLRFDNFCRDPGRVMAEVYEKLGSPLPDFDFSRIRPASGPQFEGHPKWVELAEKVGVRESL